MDRLERQMFAAVNAQKESLRESEEGYKEKSKKKMLKTITKKVTTSFIGALNKFESEFGFLWGHGKHEATLSKEELEWRAKWDKVRTDVLNNGNNQRRAVESEINQYTVSWNRYSLEIPVIPSKGD